MAFETIDISGDAGIKATGDTAAEAFADAGIGMYSLITDISRVDKAASIEFDVSGESLEELLVSYLNELIFRFDAYGFIGKEIDIAHTAGLSIYVKVHGEEFDPARHERRLLIKAATYHNIKVRRLDGYWELEVIFDI